jgi:hypothetical protein
MKLREKILSSIVTVHKPVSTERIQDTKSRNNIERTNINIIELSKILS